jgi:GNAT superfamily N-acetyltransferase
MEKYIKKINKIFTENINYFPIIGSFYASKDKRDMVWEDIFTSSKNNNFSKYDRKKIWFNYPEEKIVFKKCFYNDRYLIITTYNKRIKKYNIFYYSKNNLTLNLIQEILKEIKMPLESNYSFVCYSEPKIKKYKKFVIWKKNTKKYINNFNNLVFEYNKLNKDIKKTIEDLTLDETLEGFDFLIKNIKKFKKPIFCLVIENKIIGLIGPVNVFYDADNNKIVSAFYFGINKKYRRNGYGELLFKYFINYCYTKNIKYFLVTNRENSPASKFYEKMGAKIGNKYYKIKKNNLL